MTVIAPSYHFFLPDKFFHSIKEKLVLCRAWYPSFSYAMQKWRYCLLALLPMCDFIYYRRFLHVPPNHPNMSQLVTLVTILAGPPVQSSNFELACLETILNISQDALVHHHPKSTHFIQSQVTPFPSALAGSLQGHLGSLDFKLSPCSVCCMFSSG